MGQGAGPPHHAIVEGARRLFRIPAKPRPAKPRAIIAQVAVSGIPVNTTISAITLPA